MTRNVLKAVMIILQREMIKKKMDKYIEERVCNVKIRRFFFFLNVGFHTMVGTGSWKCDGRLDSTV